jgi:putative spermidine/putrescine transport system ATP-binding protein
MADRIAVMNGGLIEQFGSPTEVYERPRTHFVANFIGQANFLAARVGAETGRANLAGESHYKVEVDGLGQFGAIGSTGLSGSSHELVIRPHRLSVSLHPGAAQAPLAGTIERVSYTGDALAVAVRVGDQQLNAQMLTSSGDLPRIGDAAYLSWAAGDAYLLPTPAKLERLAA